MDHQRKGTSTATHDDGAKKEKTTHRSPVEVLGEPVEPDEEPAPPSTAKTDDEFSKGKSTESTMDAKLSSASEVEERITEPLPPDDKRAQSEAALKAMTGYMHGLKRAPTAAEKAYYDQCGTLVPPAEPFGKGDFSTDSATSDPWMSSDDHTTVDERSRGAVDDRATVDERSHGGVDDTQDRYDATNSCPRFPEHKRDIGCRERRVGVEAGVYFDGKPYVLEEESTSKDKYHSVRDEMEDLTDSEIREINSWMTKYLESAFVERVKGKVDEIKAKRLRKTKGKSKVSFCKSVIETEAEAPSSDLSKSEFKLVLDKMAEEQEETKNTTTELKTLGVKTVGAKPLGSLFVTRENSAFDRLIEVCEGFPAHAWADDSEDDDTNGIKLEIPSFDGRNVEAFAERFGRCLVLTGRTKAKTRVKANPIVQGIADKDLQHRVSIVLKFSRSLEDLHGSLQKLYPHVETDLSVVGEIHKVQHLPYDRKAEAVAKLLQHLDLDLNKLSPGALSEQQKLLYLASKINDKQFAEWTKDQDLSRRMHTYQDLADLMVQRVELSAGLKHLAMNRGIATGKVNSNRYHAKNEDSEGTSSTKVASNSSQPPSSKRFKDLETSLKMLENILAELGVSETGEMSKGRGKGGKGRGKGSGGGHGNGKSPL